MIHDTTHEKSVDSQELFVAWKEDVVAVRDLYRQRKYRKCAVLCAELLESAKHPVHRTFLFFYQAVCHESLGHISHNYSSNKIPLYEQARDAFISANDTLPLPFLTTAKGQYDAPGPSPACATFDLLELYNQDSSASICPTPSPLTPQNQRQISETSSFLTITADDVSVASTAPNFDDYSPREQTRGRTPTRRNHQPQQIQAASFLTPIHMNSNHKARLSRSLSSQHALAEHLVPSPLFSRPSSRKELISSSRGKLVSANTLPLVTLSKPLPPTPINRPLPALPFNHNPHFVLKGKRFLIVPRRKTALASLISRFEGTNPFDSPSPGHELTVVGTKFSSTPTTERFKRISAHFVEKENIPPITPAPIRRQSSISGTLDHDRNKCEIPATSAQDVHQQNTSSEASTPNVARNPPTYPSAPLQTYNTTLSSLRTSFLSHTIATTGRIEQTKTLQLAHEQEKRARFVARYSSRNPSLSTSPTRQSPSSNMKRGSRITPEKDTRLRSFWSLAAAEAQESSRKNNGAHKGGSTWADEEKAGERRERIARLKSEGWKGVRKEEKGWKGIGYYKELRRDVERELKGEGRGCC